MANYLDPQWKGAHLKQFNKLESTKEGIKTRWGDDGGDEAMEEAGGELSPSEMLIQSLERQADFNNNDSMESEMRRYETLKRVSAESCRLQFWRDHETALPRLAK